MVSGKLQLPHPELNSLLGVQKVNHEHEVRPLLGGDTQPLSQVAALHVSQAPGVALAAPGTGQCLGALLLTPRCATRPREPGAGSWLGFEVGFQLLSALSVGLSNFC